MPAIRSKTGPGPVSLARPGGNLTGVSILFVPRADPEGVELLAELVPQVRVIGLLVNLKNLHRTRLRSATRQEAARTKRVQLSES